MLCSSLGICHGGLAAEWEIWKCLCKQMEIECSPEVHTLGLLWLASEGSCFMEMLQGEIVDLI